MMAEIKREITIPCSYDGSEFHFSLTGAKERLKAEYDAAVEREKSDAAPRVELPSPLNWVRNGSPSGWGLHNEYGLVEIVPVAHSAGYEHYKYLIAAADELARRERTER
jgi:hypothetical protein